MNCTKCGERHFPPSGRNCQQVQEDDFIVVTSRKGRKKDNRLSNAAGHSGSLSGSPTVDRGLDSNVREVDRQPPGNLVDTQCGGPSTSQPQQAGIEKILEELQKVNRRLDVVENRAVPDREASTTPHRDFKLSSNHRQYKSRTLSKRTFNVRDDSDSESVSGEDDVEIPPLHTIRSSKAIQGKVDHTLVALGRAQECRGNDKKLKSKRGGLR